MPHPNALEFARQKLHLDPDEPSRKSCLQKTRRAILNCSRQWGKSTIAAAKALHKVFTEPDRLFLVASPTERQTRESMRKAKDMLRCAGIRIPTARAS